MSELCDNNVEGQSERQSMSGSRRVWKPHVLPRKYLEQGMLLNKNGWLVGCFGFNGSLRQYFILYQAVSQREREKEKRYDMRNRKYPNNIYPHLLQVGALPFY